MLSVRGPKDVVLIQTVQTRLGARTGALDPKTGRVYLPSAEYAAPAQSGGRPRMKPGSFAILVVGR